VDGEGRVVDGGEAGGEAGPAGVVTIFVPPPIFAEVQAVFDAPMIPHVRQDVGGRDLVGVEAGDEVPHVVRDELAAGGADLAIDADRYAAAGEVENLADVRRVVDVDPDAARFTEAPLLLFSVV
jgi:hypothetical protein